MTDPMTEGAEREWVFSHQEYGFQLLNGPQIPLFEAIRVREVSDNDPLTEALKVAGEALTKIGILSHWIGTIRWGYDGDCGSTEKASEIDEIISETRAALERIRNNKH